MRVALTEFKKVCGVDALHVTLFREAEGYVYVREMVETSGNSESDTVMELPFTQLSVLQRFISSDPYQAAMAQENVKVLRVLSEDMALRGVTEEVARAK